MPYELHSDCLISKSEFEPYSSFTRLYVFRRVAVRSFPPRLGQSNDDFETSELPVKQQVEWSHL